MAMLNSASGFGHKASIGLKLCVSLGCNGDAGATELECDALEKLEAVQMLIPERDQSFRETAWVDSGLND